MTSVRECHDCGSRPVDTPFPAVRSAGVDRCRDCAAEAARSPAARRSAYEHRALLPQRDLIDLLGPPT